MSLAKAESDKQKIADEAFRLFISAKEMVLKVSENLNFFRRVQAIKRDFDAKLESAAKAQTHQASLVERLQVSLFRSSMKHFVLQLHLKSICRRPFWQVLNVGLFNYLIKAVKVLWMSKQTWKKLPL